MSQRTGNFDDFGMATVSLAGSLEAKLEAIAAAGFTQVMMDAGDVAGHPGGVASAARAIQRTGLRLTGLQWLRDFEGLAGPAHAYKVGVAQALMQMADELGAPMLLVASTTHAGSPHDPARVARDLRKLAMLAVPLGLRIAFEGVSHAAHIRDCLSAWDAVCEADMPNLGLAIDSVHTVSSGVPLDDLELIEPDKIFVVRLADVLHTSQAEVADAGASARWPRVFPGEGQYREPVAELVQRLAGLGFDGDYSFEVVNDDFRQLPVSVVAARARAASEWLGEDVLRRSVPLPGQSRLSGHGRG